jgi:GntR family transcriptional regulator
LKIKEHIDNLIAAGNYEPGDKLPSETAFARELDVSRASLREALRVLEKEGKIIKTQGVGTFIAEPIPRFKKGIEELFSVTDTIKKEGYQAGTIGLEVASIIASKKLAIQMKVKPSTKLLQLKRIRTADGKPVVYCEDFLNIELFPLAETENFTASLFDLLENKYGLKIKYALTEINPVIANQKLVSKLEVQPNMPLLLLKQLHYDEKDQLFLYSKNYFRSDQFQFRVLRTR